ncbi:MAG: nicotinate (nicotinamide) nucleotide adenylyltransferase [Eubacteriales bacterium]|nr:nicotinate (nicotinamide) nucleotide adenylyltransferase [Lachnospiraceae bacterium]MDO5127216.1 nicotinate (nicotinamide) nucleotide adenylyltransferase [Eubacteriales bacterium]
MKHNTNYFIDWKQYDKVGILGGTFNPIHNGHLMMAKTAKFFVPQLDKIVFMPNNIPAYKNQSLIVSNEHRLAMLQCALKDMSYTTISDMELRRGGMTYTVDTLNEIHSINPALKIYFIIGADSLFSFSKWYHYKQILTKCTLLVAARNSETKKLYEACSSLTNNYSYGEIILLNNDEYNVSSSEIRTMLENGIIPENKLPNNVIHYIVNNKLYGLDKYDESRKNDGTTQNQY